MLRLAIVGLGHRAMWMLKVLRQVDPEVTLTGMVDPNHQDVRKRLAEADIQASNVLVMDSVASIVKKRDQFDGVLIGTRCSLHAPLAVELARARLPLYLEKPVAITHQQLQQLAQAYQGQEDRVVVSFPLRVTPLFEEVLEIVRCGRLGVINQIQAVNNVAYGGGYYTSWYRSFEETGGLWLQKATHDVDYINMLAGSRPVSVAAMIGRRVYDDPNVATKMEQAAQGKPDCPRPDCDILHQDAGTAVFMYDNGLHAVYSQNFVTRHEAGKRGAVITGHLGTLEFDWRSESIRVVDHFKQRVDHIVVKTGEDGHGGGDHQLARRFVDLMRNNTPALPSLTDGIISAAMCLAARESANTHQFMTIEVPGQPAPRTGPRAREAAVAI